MFQFWRASLLNNKTECSRTAVWAESRQPASDTVRPLCQINRVTYHVFHLSRQFRKTFASQLTKLLTGYCHLCHTNGSEQWNAAFLAKRVGHKSWANTVGTTQARARAHTRTHTCPIQSNAIQSVITNVSDCIRSIDTMVTDKCR